MTELTTKQKLNKQRRDFLLTYFEKNEYQKKEVNGYLLVKSWDGKNERWQVSIFTKESFERMKTYKKLL